MEDIYFVWDPINSEFLTFTTEKKQQEEAQEIIECCMDDGEWMDEVSEVVAGIITSKATQVHRTDRPKNISLDENGFNENEKCMSIWPKGMRYSCLYEMQPVRKEIDK